MEGDGTWKAINELRSTITKHERELGGIDSKLGDLSTDVDKLANEGRKTRHDLRGEVQKSEARLVAEIQKVKTELQREDADRDAKRSARWKLAATILIPSMFGVIGVLIGKL